MSKPARNLRLSDEEILRRMQDVQYSYAPGDPKALEALTERIVEAGRKRGLLTYSDLVRAIEFKLPNVNGGQPFHIVTQDWQGLHRRIVGDFLAMICRETFAAGKFMGSALVVGKSSSMPSTFFFEWMEILQVLPDQQEDTVLAFWADQVRKAHAYYARDNS